MFGSASQQVQSVKNAWNAVGVAPAWAFSYQSAQLNSTYFTAGESSANISSPIANTNDIGIEVNAIVESYDKAVSDTIPMFDDGSHNDSSANDDVYCAFWAIPDHPDYYTVSLQIFSADSNYAFLLKDQNRFTSVGPVVLESFSQTSGDTIVYPGDTKRFNFFIQNNSATDPIFNITAKAFILDSCASNTSFSNPQFGDIAPGETAHSSRSTSILFYDYCSANTTIPFVVEIYAYLFWVDTFYISTDSLLTAIGDQFTKPLEFGLKQNYPNPFKPETIINYSLKNAGLVELVVYDVTGKLIKILVKQVQSAGEYSVTFDGHKLTSGIYFYQLQAGTFNQVKRMLLVK